MKFKKKWAILGGILLIFIVLNPSINRFREYKGLTERKSADVQKPYNFLLCSVYEYENKLYLGVLFNFIDITKKEKLINIGSDSTSLMPVTLEDFPIETAYKTRKGYTYTKKQLIDAGYSQDTISAAIYSGHIVPIDSSLILNNNQMRLWSRLGYMGQYTKSYEEFKQKYSSVDSINFLFNGLTSDKLYSKGKKEFYQDFFPTLADSIK